MFFFLLVAILVSLGRSFFHFCGFFLYRLGALTSFTEFLRFLYWVFYCFFSAIFSRLLGSHQVFGLFGVFLYLRGFT